MSYQDIPIPRMFWPRSRLKHYSNKQLSTYYHNQPQVARAPMLQSYKSIGVASSSRPLPKSSNMIFNSSITPRSKTYLLSWQAGPASISSLSSPDQIRASHSRKRTWNEDLSGGTTRARVEPVSQVQNASRAIYVNEEKCGQTQRQKVNNASTYWLHFSIAILPRPFVHPALSQSHTLYVAR